MENIKLSQIFRISGRRSLYLYALLVGVWSGFAAYLFSHALAWGEFFFLEELAGLKIPHPTGEYFIASAHPPELNPWILFFLPVLGGLTVGLIISSFCPEAAGNGTDEMIHSFHHKEGKMNIKVPFIKSIATIITLSTGGSGGKEGPIAQIGAGFGSWIGGLLKAGARARRTLLLAGTAGGLGAIFHAPLGGAITAVELVYREDFESDSLMPCIISSVTAYLVYASMQGFGSIYRVDVPTFQNYNEILFYVILGILCFLLGTLFIKVFHGMQDLMAKLSIPNFLKPAIGGVFIGCIALVFPEALGTGAGILQEAVDGRFLGAESGHPVEVLLALFLFTALMKILATSVTIGSGASAGIFGPSLFIGGMLGGAVGTLASVFLDGQSVSIGSFILVGMGAFYSGVASAPVAGMVMVSEIIGSYALLPPLMLVAIIIFVLHSRSIYRNQMENRFVSPAHFWDMNQDVMDRIIVKNAFQSFRRQAMVSQTMLLKDLEAMAPEIQAGDFVVYDNSEKYLGMVSLRKNRILAESREFVGNLITVQDALDASVPAVTLESKVGEVLQIIMEYDVDKVAVVEKGNLLGYLGFIDLMKAYRESMVKTRALS